jgi:hypothetical protein
MLLGASFCPTMAFVCVLDDVDHGSMARNQRCSTHPAAASPPVTYAFGCLVSLGCVALLFSLLAALGTARCLRALYAVSRVGGSLKQQHPFITDCQVPLL